MVNLDVFQGHIILYCKGHYKVKTDKFFEGLKRIWAVRCGYDYEHSSSDILVYVANDMYRIIAACQPERLSYLMEVIHKEVGNQAFYKPQNMTPIEAIIWEYRSIISNLQVREKVDNKWKLLINIPKLKKQIFNRILNGNYRNDDYDKITKSK
jgi:hypothetical protein